MRQALEGSGGKGAYKKKTNQYNIIGEGGGPGGPRVARWNFTVARPSIEYSARREDNFKRWVQLLMGGVDPAGIIISKGLNAESVPMAIKKKRKRVTNNEKGPISA